MAVLPAFDARRLYNQPMMLFACDSTPLVMPMGNWLGWLLILLQQGFSSLIKAMVGFYPMALSIIRLYLSTKNSSLGDKIQQNKSEWSLQYNGVHPGTFDLRMTKDGGKIDGIWLPLRHVHSTTSGCNVFTILLNKTKEAFNMNNYRILQRLYQGKTGFVMLLGLCPALGVTTSTFNSYGHGLASAFVLVMSNVVVSMIKNFILIRCASLLLL